MTDSCFDTFLNNAYYQLTIKAYEKSKSLKLVRFNVIDKGDYYEFNGRLEAGDATIKLKGSAQTDEEGLVNNFTIYNSISEIL